MGNRLVNHREAAATLWEFGGLEFSVDDLVRLSGIPSNVLRQRLMAGWDLERAVTAQVRRSQWAKVRWIGPVWEREGRIYI